MIGCLLATRVAKKFNARGHSKSEDCSVAQRSALVHVILQDLQLSRSVDNLLVEVLDRRHHAQSLALLVLRTFTFDNSTRLSVVDMSP